MKKLHKFWIGLLALVGVAGLCLAGWIAYGVVVFSQADWENTENIPVTVEETQESFVVQQKSGFDNKRSYVVYRGNPEDNNLVAFGMKQWDMMEYETLPESEVLLYEFDGNQVGWWESEQKKVLFRYKPGTKELFRVKGDVK